MSTEVFNTRKYSFRKGRGEFCMELEKIAALVGNKMEVRGIAAKKKERAVVVPFNNFSVMLLTI
jgi:hypothetical protein